MCDFAEEVGAEARIEQLSARTGSRRRPEQKHGSAAVVYLGSVATCALTPRAARTRRGRMARHRPSPGVDHAHESFAVLAREVWAARGCYARRSAGGGGLVDVDDFECAREVGELRAESGR